MSIRQIVSIAAVGLAVVAGVVVAPSTAFAASFTDSVPVNTVLHGGDQLAATSGQFKLAMQTDGNAVIYSRGQQVLWTSNTGGNPGAYLKNQGDGDLVVYSSSNVALWASLTSGAGGALAMQNDGNLVFYSASSTVIWASGTHLDQIVANESLLSGDFIRNSADTKLAMQTDGNLVLYQGSSAVWFSNTGGHPGAHAVLQGDGNLVVYSGATALWQSGTASQSVQRLVVQSNGNLALLRPDGSTAWSTNTGVSSDVQELAQRLVAAHAANQFTTSPSSIYTNEILPLATGPALPGCAVDTRVLQILVLLLDGFTSIRVNDLQRPCIGSSLNCPGSPHCLNPGKAIDLGSVGGTVVDGSNSQSLNVLHYLDAHMPSGSRTGQVNCRTPAISLVHMSQFTDFCTHIHIDLGNASGPVS